MENVNVDKKQIEFLKQKSIEAFLLSIEILYMAFQKGTQTAPQGEIMPPQAGI